MRKAFFSIVCAVALPSLASADLAIDSCGGEAIFSSAQREGLRLAQKEDCAISERCFDGKTGKWNGKCPCLPCYRKLGFC